EDRPRIRAALNEQEIFPFLINSYENAVKEIDTWRRRPHDSYFDQEPDMVQLVKYSYEKLKQLYRHERSCFHNELNYIDEQSMNDANGEKSDLEKVEQEEFVVDEPEPNADDLERIKNNRIREFLMMYDLTDG